MPDSAKNATKLVEQILQALPTDAKAIGATASIKPTGIYDKLLSEGLEIAVKLIAGARRGAGEAIGVASSAEAHLAPKVASSTWKTFASFVGDTKIMTQYLTEIAAARLTLKGRRVIMVETSEFGELGAGAAREAVASGIANTLTTRLGASSQKVALAVRGTAEHAAVVRWALEHDVPVVLGSLQQNAAEALVSLSHAVDGHDAYVFFVGASTNPKMLALIQNINVAKVDSTSTKMFEALDLTPVWAVSDEALSIRFGRHDGPFFGWLQRFEVSTRTTF